MKKIIPFLIFTFTLLIMYNVESKGQCSCPTTTGWQQVTFPVLYKAGDVDCRVDITYCYFCGDNSLHREIYFCKADLKHYSYSPTEPNYCDWSGVDIGSQEFWDVIYEHMIYDMFYRCTTIPFCDDLTANAVFRRFTEIKKSSCMKSVFNPILFQTEIRPCENEALCVIEYDVCIGLENAVITKGLSYEIGESNCPRKIVGAGGSAINPPGANYMEGTCFNPCY